jgi:protocatechuate 3,4-dioxygenase beta subunit
MFHSLQNSVINRKANASLVRRRIPLHSLLRIAILLALLFSFQPLTPAAFLAQDSKEVGTITGRVLLGGKPAQSVIVMATPSMSDPSKIVEQMLKPLAPLKAVTDVDGRYRLEGVPAGKYTVVPSSPTSVNTEAGAGKEVNVTDASTAEDIDFSLTRGGVITGKITDSDGRPVIAEEVSLNSVDPSKPGGQSITPGGRVYVTDDRGIYRIFALAPGRYIVSAGSSHDPFTTLFAKRPKRVQTYYPGVTEETKAKPVEVIAGAEASGVDIKLGVSDKGFAVNGRVLAAETGAPIAGAMLSYTRAQENPADPAHRDNSSDMPGGMTTTNAKGEFRFDSLAPGKYSVEVVSMGALTGASESFYADPVNLEVQSGNIDKIEIKVHLGASISGVVVVEGVDAANTPDTTIPLVLIALVADAQTTSKGAWMASSMPSMSKVAADGSFRIGGLRAGKANIRAVPYGTQKFSVVRIEHDGVGPLDGMDIQPNEQITGVRVVVVPANCVIRGRVTVQGGTLPPGTQISVWARALNGDPTNSVRASADSKGNFVIEDLAPGDYEVEITANVQGSEGSRRVSAKQSVTVNAGVPAEVSLMLNLKVPDK